MKKKSSTANLPAEEEHSTCVHQRQEITLKDLRGSTLWSFPPPENKGLLTLPYIFHDFPALEHRSASVTVNHQSHFELQSFHLSLIFVIFKMAKLWKEEGFKSSCHNSTWRWHHHESMRTFFGKCLRYFWYLCCLWFHTRGSVKWNK